MARPYKQGIDYFPFDVDLLSDRKLRRPKEKYGYLATVVYIELLCLIYKDKGYYLDYSEDVREDVQLDILDCLRGKYQPSLEDIEKVIADLVAVGLFSTELYSQNIITSHRLQCTYYKATSDRKNVSIDWDKWLLDEDNMRGLGSSHIILKNYINRQKNEVNHLNNSINHPINQESKVNKSKVNKSNNTAAPDEYFENTEINTLFLEFLDMRKSMKVKNTDRAINLLLDELRPLSDQEKKAAIEKSIMNGYRGIFPDSIHSKPNKPDNEVHVTDNRRKSYQDSVNSDEAWLWGVDHEK